MRSLVQKPSDCASSLFFFTDAIGTLHDAGRTILTACPARRCPQRGAVGSCVYDDDCGRAISMEALLALAGAEAFVPVERYARFADCAELSVALEPNAHDAGTIRRAVLQRSVLVSLLLASSDKKLTLARAQRMLGMIFGGVVQKTAK